MVAMVANLAVFYGAVHSDAVFGGDFLALARGWSTAIPAGLGVVLTGVLNAQLDATTKERLVFLRWSTPLPGCRAFSYYAARDPRVDSEELRQRFGPLPDDPKLQNALWYRLYKTVADEVSVLQVYKEYLFARDYTAMSAIIGVALGGIGLFEIPSPRTALIYIAVLVAQFILARRAAANHGCRFVTTVLALKGAGR